MEGCELRAESGRIAANLVQCNEAVVAVEGGVFESLAATGPLYCCSRATQRSSDWRE